MFNESRSYGVGSTFASENKHFGTLSLNEFNYEIDRIEVGNKTISGTTFIFEGDIHVGVYFKKKDYKVTIKYSVGGTAFLLQNTARIDEPVIIKTTPKPGYEVDRVTVNGNVINNPATSFKMGAEDTEVFVYFKKITYTVNLYCSNNGTATLSQNTAVIGDEITVETKPNENYYAIIEVNGNDISGNRFTLSEAYLGNPNDRGIHVLVSFAKIEQLPVGETVTSGDYEYKVTVDASSTGCGSVMLTKTVDAVAKAVVVPSIVSIKGVDYKVTGIANNAFANDPELTTLTIGNNVTVIGTNAFLGCKKLVRVSGGARIKTIGSKAFASCPKLSSFTISSPYLAKIGTYAFSGDSSLKTIYIKNTTKLSKKGVNKSLNSSKVMTVKVKKSKIKKYKKYFTKKNCGRKVKVKK